MSQMPHPTVVGRRAAEILTSIEADEAYPRLATSAQRYSDCWASFTGYPIICEWNIDSDKGPLFREAMRALALKAAVYELTDKDENAAELLLPLPVDEMTHAILAQHTLVTGLQIRVGVLLPHMTDLEEFGYEPGDYTDQCYGSAWNEPDRRYWVGTTEAKRRLKILNRHYKTAYIGRDGRYHSLTFDETVSV